MIIEFETPILSVPVTTRYVRSFHNKVNLSILIKCYNQGAVIQIYTYKWTDETI